MTDSSPSPSPSSADVPASPRRITRGGALLLALSALIMVGGLVGISIAALTPEEEPTAPDSVSSALPRGFAGNETSSTSIPTEPEPGTLETWSPAVFRLGFSFFVGFCIAYAVRSFVKISLVAIGVILLALFGLQYAGVIDVDWTAMESHFDRISAWIREETATFTAFVKGYLPSTVSAGAGLIAGFRRSR